MPTFKRSNDDGDDVDTRQEYAHNRGSIPANEHNILVVCNEMTTKTAHELDRLALPYPFLRITHGVSDDRPAMMVTCNGDLYKGNP